MRSIAALFLLSATLLTGCAHSGNSSKDVFAMDPSFQSNSQRKISSAHFPPAPPESVFDDVRTYTKKRNYLGNDFLVCTDTQTGKMKMGGTGHWSGTFQLFMDYAGGRMDMGVFSRTSAVGAKIETYSDGGNLTMLMDPRGAIDNMATYLTTIKNQSGQTSVELDCYLQSSGLE
jgi:hypothetical protein